MNVRNHRTLGNFSGHYDNSARYEKLGLIHASRLNCPAASALREKPVPPTPDATATSLPHDPVPEVTQDLQRALPPAV